MEDRIEQSLHALSDAVHTLQAERAVLATNQRSVLSSIDAIREARSVLIDVAYDLVKIYDEVKV